MKFYMNCCHNVLISGIFSRYNKTRPQGCHTWRKRAREGFSDLQGKIEAKIRLAMQEAFSLGEYRRASEAFTPIVRKRAVKAGTLTPNLKCRSGPHNEAKLHYIKANEQSQTGEIVGEVDAEHDTSSVVLQRI